MKDWRGKIPVEAYFFLTSILAIRSNDKYSTHALFPFTIQQPLDPIEGKNGISAC